MIYLFLFNLPSSRGEGGTTERTKMKLIFGGAYQGKLDYAKKKNNLTDGQIFACTENSEVDFSARCIYGIEAYALRCVREGTDVVQVFREHREDWQDSILICRDIFCGVVPIQAEQRAWREQTGRLCAYLSSEAASVVRIFCGLEQRLK